MKYETSEFMGIGIAGLAITLLLCVPLFVSGQFKPLIASGSTEVFWANEISDILEKRRVPVMQEPISKQETNVESVSEDFSENPPVYNLPVWEGEDPYSEYNVSYDYGYSGEIYRAEYDPAYNTNGPSREMPGWYNGYLETYYNASSHYLANTWTLDEEGFYHDENGRYVVGVEIGHADEMPYGTVVETGRGEGVVYDYGSGAEVHDFATTW